MLVVWNLDRLGRSLAHLVTTVEDLAETGVGLASAGRPGGAHGHVHWRRGGWCSGSVVALAEFERELIRERTIGRTGGGAGPGGTRAEGRATVRADEGPGAPRAGRDGEPGHDRGGAVLGNWVSAG